MSGESDGAPRRAYAATGGSSSSAWGGTSGFLPNQHREPSPLRGAVQLKVRVDHAASSTGVVASRCFRGPASFRRAAKTYARSTTKRPTPARPDAPR